MSNIKPFIDQYDCKKKIDFPSHKKDLEKFELNAKSITVNILHVPHNIEEIRHAYKSKYDLKRENQVILLIITDSEKQHDLIVKILSALLIGITSKHYADFYCLNCFHSCRTENKFEKHKNVCEEHNYCYVEMPNEDNKILEYNHREKPMKVPFVLYAA